MIIRIDEKTFTEVMTVLSLDTDLARMRRLVGAVVNGASTESPILASTECGPPGPGLNDHSTKCDMQVGPCSCGAWHGSGPAKAKEPRVLYAAPSGVIQILGPTVCEYQVYVQCQDGIEHVGYTTTEKSACELWAGASIQYGNKLAKPSDARIYEAIDGQYHEISRNRKDN